MRNEPSKVASAYRLMALGGAALTLGACALVPPTPATGPLAGYPGNFDRALLAPGRTAMCTMDPCAAYYQLPPGSGTRTVRVNNLVAGTGDDSEPFFVGSYYRFQSPGLFTVDGTNLPPAVLWVSSRP